jgi:hypothetical protein
MSGKYARPTEAADFQAKNEFIYFYGVFRGSLKRCAGFPDRFLPPPVQRQAPIMTLDAFILILAMPPMITAAALAIPTALCRALPPRW